MEYRPLGQTDLQVSVVALGTWPISGITSLGVNDVASHATINAALDLGINFFDTAFCYGENGESERLLQATLGKKRDRVVIATKCGVHWEPGRKQVCDGRPITLRSQCHESLRRLNTDRVELLYLHAPDPRTPVAESAGELHCLLREGKTRSVGVSNVTVAQLVEFAAECPISAFQPLFNMLQREAEDEAIPWCQEREISVCVYWPLMKGLLTGKFSRSHRFDPQDGRRKYPMFQGTEWERNLDFLDELQIVAAGAGRSVAQVVVNWTIHRRGITSALCGAGTPGQIHETAGATGWSLGPDQLAQIDRAIANRGKILSGRPMQGRAS